MSLARTVKQAFERFGFQLSANEQPIYADRPAAERAIAAVAGNTMLPRGRLVSLFDQSVFCARQGIRGAFVECGVWKGGGVGLMAAALLEEGEDERHLHLFDSFTDICAPDPEMDGARALQEVSGREVRAGPNPTPLTGIYDRLGGHGTIAACRALIEGRIGYPPERVHYHQGWFQDTLPEQAAAIGEIALLRLDGDWYASTKVCLEHLYDQVVPRGFVIIDDYGTYEGCRKAVDEFLAARGLAPFLCRVDGGCYFFVKP
ncbi:MAG TPA: TylF/MycF/NovP-related O-methyltransferase [Allosphingosinicella sp.]|nr:TylF/MycF/NovP-related O-methyltransferase [Allosphingosinicella sp.]